MEILAAYLVLGAFAGTVAGLLGVGGGLVIVPVLALLFSAQGMSGDVFMHMAVGTSLATIVVTAVSSAAAHHRRGAVDWPVFWRLSPGIVAGALLGSAIAGVLPSSLLRGFFGVFEIGVAIQMAFGARPAPHRQLPGATGTALAGFLIGIVSAIVGIGGGTMTVPFLVWCNVGMRRAVATSAACGLPIALAGAVGFTVAGWNAASLPAMSTGYVYWPAVAGIVIASILFAPLGARLAHTLPVPLLKRFFAIFLAALGLRMLI
ncbi:MAG: sulfite exporter TauE/SafE family protein [Gammaproteobacteria bacterium]|nr:sulfite exporter TauE/SafE family protein [Gammaproteobacteria bacterium]NIT62238.1 sulfite exporter TauE/SafE family protein [Gammaproteobacteria bacterium]NIV19068.1 TSUP family transporter [Gammaproteobacteria bacterium]NIY30818.1 TSUP family transporter [Gammaproteobacteria bacterium]